jgi:hypothetical protein
MALPPLYAAPQANQYPSLCEDSLPLKMLSALPFIGSIPRMIATNSLNDKFCETRNSSRLIEVIHVKNDFKRANIASNMILNALIIVGLATGFITGTLGIIASIAAILLTSIVTGVINSSITENNKMVSTILAANEPMYMQEVRLY